MPPELDDCPREVYFEFTPVGGVVKVAAIDAETGIEIAVVGPAADSQTALERPALAKLKARIGRGP